MRKETTPISAAKMLAHLSWALAAVAAVFSLATVADAASRNSGSSASGGKFTSNSGILGTTTGKGSDGRPNGGKTTDGGKNTDGGHDRPRKTKWKPPIIVIVPPVVTAVTPVLGTGNSNAGGQNNQPAQFISRGNGIPPANERRYVPDQVLVELSSTQSSQALDALLLRHRLTRLESLPLNASTLSLLRISDRRTVPAVLRALAGEGIVAWSQPNYLYTAQQTAQPPAPEQQPAAPVSAGEPAQYALAKLRLPQAHALAKGDKVLIAVIDSSVDTAHPELAGMVVDSFNALGSEEKPHSHGTAIVGAIVAHAKLMGSAPDARILAVTAFGAKANTTEGTTFNITKGIEWSLARGARVINMSFAGPADPQIERKIAEARRRGIILIAAAGNAGPKSAPLYPAAYPNVIAVTATDADDKLFRGANRGRHIAVAAPGVDILLPAPEAAYQMTSGTSFAAAEVSGIVALMLERKPDLGQDEVRRVLTGTARDLGPKGFDRQFGAGLVDAYRAVMSLTPAAAETAGQGNPIASKK